jgi:hypothetical protein
VAKKGAICPISEGYWRHNRNPVKVNIAEGVDRKQLLSHYEFRKQIALNWLDSSYEPTTNEIKDGPRKKNGSTTLFSSPSSVSTITTASSRAAFCNDSSLADTVSPSIQKERK